MNSRGISPLGRRRRRARAVAVLSFLAGAAVGGVAAYGFDPVSGRRRRHTARDRVAGISRRGARRLLRGGSIAAAQARGRTRGLLHGLRPQAPRHLDDAELAHKVETIVFRDPRLPKGPVSVNAEDGCVFLRGEIERPELVAELEEAVRRVPGVREVENLLHLPGTPAPHAGVRRASRRQELP
jgi:BON domain